jgi:restriction-modification enzyme MmeI-like protein
MSKIRVFDPACGSGNFLVIAYKEICPAFTGEYPLETVLTMLIIRTVSDEHRENCQ